MDPGFLWTSREDSHQLQVGEEIVIDHVSSQFPLLEVL
jgi:hypothetical protein